MFASGAPAALLETVPWIGGKHDAEIRASSAAHAPSKRPATADTAATETVNLWVAAAAASSRGLPMSDLGEWDEPEVSDQPSVPVVAQEPEVKEAPEPELFYKDLVSFVQEHLSPSYRRSLSGTTEHGARRGGNTKKPSANWKHYGDRGNSSASTVPQA